MRIDSKIKMRLPCSAGQGLSIVSHFSSRSENPGAPPRHSRRSGNPEPLFDAARIREPRQLRRNGWSSCNDGCAEEMRWVRCPVHPPNICWPDRVGAQSGLWIPAPARMTGDNETALLSGSLIRYSRPAPWSGSWGQNWMANISGGAIRNTPPVSYRPWSSKARRCQGGVSRVIRLSPQLGKGSTEWFSPKGSRVRRRLGPVANVPFLL